MTKQLHFHCSLSCLGEGNGNPLRCFCLENPGDRGAWWAAVCGVAQSRTRLKWLSSSSSRKVSGRIFNRMLTQVSCSDGLLSGFYFLLCVYFFIAFITTWHIPYFYYFLAIPPINMEALSNVISPVLSVVPGIWQECNKYLLNALIMFLWLEFFFIMIIYTLNKYIFSKSTWFFFSPKQWHCKLEVITIRSRCQLNLGDCLPKGRTHRPHLAQLQPIGHTSYIIFLQLHNPRQSSTWY